MTGPSVALTGGVSAFSSGLSWPRTRLAAARLTSRKSHTRAPRPATLITACAPRNRLPPRFRTSVRLEARACCLQLHLPVVDEPLQQNDRQSPEDQPRPQ